MRKFDVVNYMMFFSIDIALISGCDYVLHSTGQLYSHKRKHERRDFEHAYRKFKEDQRPKPSARPILPSPTISTTPSQMIIAQTPPAGISSRSTPIKKEAEYIDLEDLSKFTQSDDSNSSSPIPTDLSAQKSLSSTPMRNTMITTTPSTTVEVKVEAGEGNSSKPHPSTLAKLASKLSGSSLGDSLSLPIPSYNEEEQMKTEMAFGDAPAVPSGVKVATSDVATCPPGATLKFVPKLLPVVNDKKEKDESWKKYLTR